MTRAVRPPGAFRYDHYELDRGEQRLTCHYSLGGHDFAERVWFSSPGDWNGVAAEAAARLVFLLAGVSYYKVAAPPVVDLGSTATTELERRFLRTYYIEGLAELAFRNRLDLSGLRIEGPDLDGPGMEPAETHGHAEDSGPLVPFGGGIDSIVVAESVRRGHPGTALFVVSPKSGPFAAIEGAAAASGLPVVRATRALDPKLLRSADLGFLNGHVPVTGIVSAIATMAAAVEGRRAVVMANEWSASAPTTLVDGRTVNHQWSKGAVFERAFRDVLRESLPGIEYFSLLRPYSELWVARRFADLKRYHRVFRSCNRAFSIDPAKRADRWCGECDKCCFINLILAPFLPAAALKAIFDGAEPLSQPALYDRMLALVGLGEHAKPFECVGDVGECRAAVRMAAARPDRAHCEVVQALDAALRDQTPAGDAAGAERWLGPLGDDNIPRGYAPEDQLV